MAEITQKQSWRETLSVYFTRNMLIVFALGMASGFPLLLTGSTLMAALQEGSVNITLIGAFALLGIPYTLKFLWAPVVDAVKLGQTHLDHRRRWLWSIQFALVLSLLGMSFCDPTTSLELLGIFALLVAFFSATQDIIIDAVRVEMLSKEDQGAGAAMAVSGYRIGMLIAGAGALLAATYIPWSSVYKCAAGFMFLCMPIVLAITRLHEPKNNDLDVTDENERSLQQENTSPDNPSLSNEATSDEKKHAQRSIFYRAVVAPLKDFFGSRTIFSALMILLFIVLFKLGDAMAGSLSMPFYLDMGFSKPEIVAVSKVLGLIATLSGTFLGGFIVKRLSLGYALLLCGTVQLLSNFVFVWLAMIGHSIPALTIAICVENVTGGMGTAAFVAFMASLCNVEFTATQYALFSALSSVGRTLFASTGGVIVSTIGWAGFYTSTAIFAVPGMLLLLYLRPLISQGEKQRQLAAAGSATPNESASP